jgi:hypothetical protein
LIRNSYRRNKEKEKMKSNLFIYKHKCHGVLYEGIIDFLTVTAVCANATHSDMERTDYKITITFKEGNHIDIPVVSDEYELYMKLIKELMTE